MTEMTSCEMCLGISYIYTYIYIQVRDLGGINFSRNSQLRPPTPLIPSSRQNHLPGGHSPDNPPAGDNIGDEQIEKNSNNNHNNIKRKKKKITTVYACTVPPKPDMTYIDYLCIFGETPYFAAITSILDPLILTSLAQLSDMLSLINDNDNDFKGWLDQYKYADRYPEQTPEYYREQGEVFLKKLENRLSHHPFLFGIKMRLADIAIMPFVRQFAHVDKKWFEAADYPFLQNWLQAWLESDDFQKIMFKYLKWTG